MKVSVIVWAIILGAATCTGTDGDVLEKLEKEMGRLTLVSVETSLGTFQAALFEDRSPITVKNFLQYVDSGFYDGGIFHRVIQGFIIQGGGLSADFTVMETGEPIRNEAKNRLKNKRGTIAMARTGIIDSATSQFFINLADNDILDHKNETATGFGYAVFGQVVSGMDVIDAIGNVRTGEKFVDPEHKRGLYYDVPQETVLIRSVRRK